MGKIYWFIVLPRYWKSQILNEEVKSIRGFQNVERIESETQRACGD